MLWYPIKEESEVSAFVRKLGRSGIGKMLRMELIVATAAGGKGLRGSGLIVVNPPWTLHDEINVMLPALARILSRGATYKTTNQWIAGELSR